MPFKTDEADTFMYKDTVYSITAIRNKLVEKIFFFIKNNQMFGKFQPGLLIKGKKN